MNTRAKLLLKNKPGFGGDSRDVKGMNSRDVKSLKIEGLFPQKKTKTKILYGN